MAVKAILALLVFGFPVVFGDDAACARSEALQPNYNCSQSKIGQSCLSFLGGSSSFVAKRDNLSCCIEISSLWPSYDFSGGYSNDHILYILYDSLPVLILVPLILFFNINLASGPGHSLVFTYQVLVAVFHSIHLREENAQPCGYSSSGVLFALGPLVLFNDPLFLFWRDQALTHYALGYVKIVIAFIVLSLVTLFMSCSKRCNDCCSCWAKLWNYVRAWRKQHLPQHPVLVEFFSVGILMYGSLVEVSFRLLVRCELADKVCQHTGPHTSNSPVCYWYEHTASSQPLCWGSPAHMPYFVIAWIFIGVAVLLSLPFFYHTGVPALVSYLTRGRVQLPRLHRLEPLLDVFQGVYKPRMQFFAGLHLLYRVAVWSAVAFASTNTKLYALLYLWLIILAMQCVFQPFKSCRHNYLEILLMVNVALVALSLSMDQLVDPYSLIKFETVVPFVAGALAHFPLFCCVVYYLYQFVRWYCCSARGCSHYVEIVCVEVDKSTDLQGRALEPSESDSLLDPPRMYSDR